MTETKILEIAKIYAKENIDLATSMYNPSAECIAAQAYYKGYTAAQRRWFYPAMGEYPKNVKLTQFEEYNPLVLVFMYRYDDHGKAAKVYALDRWEPDCKRWQNNRHDKIEGWQYLPEFDAITEEKTELVDVDIMENGRVIGTMKAEKKW